jgi:glutamate 5-kinase
MRQEANIVPASRVVIKIGTSSLVTGGELDQVKVDALCETVAAGISAGLAPVLVTSGAIAIGRTRYDALAEATPAARQAAAALGQGLLYAALRLRFAACGVETGQILLTPFDLTDLDRGEGVRPAFDLMRTLGILPIVNENDALGVRNNDVLAAILSGYLRAELLLLLTNVAGLYAPDPLLGGTAARITEVTNEITEVERIADDSSDRQGTGGMLVKLGACWIATHAGIRAVIANAMDPSVLLAAYRGADIGTVFQPRPTNGTTPDLGRLWRAFRTPPRGLVICRMAGLVAVERGLTLRRADIAAVRGTFAAGDVVDVLGPDSRMVARGSIRHGSLDADGSCAPHTALLTGSDYVQIVEGEPCR